MPGPKYTQEEDAIIMMYYGDEGAEVRHRLPNQRSVKSVEYRAAILRKKVKKPKRVFKAKWTKPEMDSMKMLFGELGCEGMYVILKGRFSIESIRHKARRMELCEVGPKQPPQPEPEPIDPNEEDTAPMIHRHIPEGEWKRDHPIPRRSVFDVEARA